MSALSYSPATSPLMIVVPLVRCWISTSRPASRAKPLRTAICRNVDSKIALGSAWRQRASAALVGAAAGFAAAPGAAGAPLGAAGVALGAPQASTTIPTPLPAARRRNARRSTAGLRSAPIHHLPASGASSIRRPAVAGASCDSRGHRRQPSGRAGRPLLAGDLEQRDVVKDVDGDGD